MQSKPNVPESQRRRVVGVPSHHRGGCQRIGHARRELVHSVAPGGVTHDVNLVGIYIFENDSVFDDSFEKLVNVILVPKVPGIGGRSGREVYTLFWLIESDLVSPLTVVDCSRCPPTAVHRDEKTPTRHRLFTEDSILKFHGLIAQIDRLRFPFRFALFTDGSLEITKQKFRGFFCVVLAQ